LKYFAVPLVAVPKAATAPVALPVDIALPSALERAAPVGIPEAPPIQKPRPIARVRQAPAAAPQQRRRSTPGAALLACGVVASLAALAFGFAAAVGSRKSPKEPVARPQEPDAPLQVSQSPHQRRIDSTAPPVPDPGPAANAERDKIAPVPPSPEVAPPRVVFDPPPLPPLPPIAKKGLVPAVGKAIAGLDQNKIDEAIARGVKFLKGVDPAAHGGGHRLGYAALSGLTLLECKTPAADGDVQKLARTVRAEAASETRTYELALSILFLDRLGDARDRPLIQTMALRLIAGQNASGGWTYHNPILSERDSKTLLAFLNPYRRTNPLDNMAGKPAEFLNPATKDAKTLAGVDGESSIPVAVSKDPKMLSGSAGEPKLTSADGTKLASPLDIPPKAMPAANDTPALKPKPKPLESLPANLQQIPAVNNDFRPGGKKKEKGPFAKGPFAKGAPGGDNSNTQFAMLGLWAARRHGVGAEPALLLADKRFATSQNDDGGWGYHVNSFTRNTMNCVGLMGLAMGHGAGFSANPLHDPKNAKNALPADPQIQKGLAALGRYLGDPAADPASTSMENLYFLWSVERVAMLYDLKTIGGKDWYGWGAQMLVHHQNADGTWTSRSYAGRSPVVDTCFALLFLKRSNLVQDLSEELRIYIAITDPASAPK
jgi:hypothetical protein